MKHVRQRAVGLVLFAAILISFGYISAQQKPTQQPGRTQSAASQPTQQNEQLRDQVAELQKQVQDLQAAMDDLKAQQQVIGASVKETRELVLSAQIEQKQAREKQDSVVSRRSTRPAD